MKHGRFFVWLMLETVPCGDLHQISPFPFPKTKNPKLRTDVWSEMRRVNHHSLRLLLSYSYSGFQPHEQPRGAPHQRQHPHRRPHLDHPRHPLRTRPIHDENSNASVSGLVMEDA